MRLILIRGLPGSGKTSLARRMKNRITDHYEADMFFEKNGRYEPDLKKLPEAHGWCFQKTCESLSRGRSVIVSNTFSQLWEMDQYIDAAHRYAADLRVIRCTGKFKSIHNIPDEHMNNYAEQFECYPGEEFHEGGGHDFSGNYQLL